MVTQLGALRQVGQPIADLDRAIAFYRDALGLRLIANPGPLAFFDLAGVRLLMEKGTAGTGSVLYLAVPDIHQARQELESRGVAFVDEPHVIYRDADGTFGPAGEDEWMARVFWCASFCKRCTGRSNISRLCGEDKFGGLADP